MYRGSDFSLFLYVRTKGQKDKWNKSPSGVNEESVSSVIPQEELRKTRNGARFDVFIPKKS